VYTPLQMYLRYFPIRAGKQRLLNMTWRIAPSSRDVVTTLIQARIKMACDLSQYVQRQLFFWGSYEREMCAYWVQHTDTARVVFDVGANVGIYTLLAANCPHVTVHAFEPTASVANRLLHNIEINHFSNVVVNIAAVGKSTGSAFLHDCRGAGGNNEGMNFVTLDKVNVSDVPVSIMALDDYCQQRAIHQIDLLKLDIEGGEYAALLGAASLLECKAIKLIVLELCEWAANRSHTSTKDIKHLLKDVGYALYKLHRGKLHRVEDDSPEDGFNFVAVPDAQSTYGYVMSKNN
jgi:FkbM family methyltransferase